MCPSSSPRVTTPERSLFLFFGLPPCAPGNPLLAPFVARGRPMQAFRGGPGGSGARRDPCGGGWVGGNAPCDFLFIWLGQGAWKGRGKLTSDFWGRGIQEGPFSSRAGQAAPAAEAPSRSECGGCGWWWCVLSRAAVLVARGGGHLWRRRGGGRPLFLLQAAVGLFPPRAPPLACGATFFRYVLV